MGERGEIRFGDSVIAYKVKRSARRRKTLEIAVEEPGLVRVAAPIDLPAARIEAVLRRKSGWILRNYGSEFETPPIRRFVSGESVPYLGRAVQMTVQSAEGHGTKIRFNHWKFDVDVPCEIGDEDRRLMIRSAFEKWYRERAALKLPPRVDRIGGLLGVRPKEILIRDQRSRWGSCAPDGTVRFNWRIIMAPPAILDYIVAHELAHLRVRKHSAEYWAVVEQAIPDYRLRRERLREIGANLRL